MLIGFMTLFLQKVVYQFSKTGTISLKLSEAKFLLYINGLYVFFFVFVWQIQEMMTSIKSSFREETARYKWIDDQTRKKINEKV